MTSTDSNDLLAICANCGTSVTVRWRISSSGENVCNACGIYERKHGVSRPVEMIRRDKRRRGRVVAAYLKWGDSVGCTCTRVGGCHHSSPSS